MSESTARHNVSNTENGEKWVQSLMKQLEDHATCPEYAKAVVREAVEENIALRRLLEEKKKMKTVERGTS